MQPFAAVWMAERLRQDVAGRPPGAVASGMKLYNDGMNPHDFVRETTRAAAALFAFGAANALYAAAVPTVPDTMQQRVAACASCHGAHGEGLPGDVKIPRLAGKPAAYLLQQLQSFQDGRRHHAPMEYVVRQLSPAYLQQIADYFSAQQVPFHPQPVPATSADALRRGEQLVHHGDPARGIPSCESCHGSTLTGVQPSMPGLTGLSYAYIQTQLDAWRTHQRSSDGPGCMTVVANRMTVGDVTAVSAWLASQAPPSNPHPLPASAQTEPLPGWCVVGNEEAQR